MSENPLPPVPERARPILSWVSWALFLGLPSLGGLVALMSEGKGKAALVILLGLLGAFAAALKDGLARPRGGSPPAIMALGLLVMVSACTGAPWRVVAGVQAAGNLTDKAIATAARRQIATCLGQHGKASPKYRPCVEESRPWKALRHWRDTAVPAVNSATLATVAALQIADQTRGVKKVDWMAALKPAVCALARVVREWGSVLGPAKTTVMVAVSAAEGVTCD